MKKTILGISTAVILGLGLMFFQNYYSFQGAGPWQTVYDFQTGRSYLNLIPFGKDCTYRITVNASLYNDGIWHPLMTHIYPHKTSASATDSTAAKYSINLSFADQDINEAFHVTVPAIVGEPPSSGVPPDQTQEIQIDISNTGNAYNARWSGRELGIAENLGPDFYGVPLTLTTINPGQVTSSVIEASCQNYALTPVAVGISTFPKAN